MHDAVTQLDMLVVSRLVGTVFLLRRWSMSASQSARVSLLIRLRSGMQPTMAAAKSSLT